MTAGLVEFLRARLDEDEQVARRCDGDACGRWTTDGTTVDFCQSEMEGFHTAYAAHIVRHDPARVLAEVEAKRQIIDLYAAALEAHADTRAQKRAVLDKDPDGFGKLHRRASELIGAAETLAPVARLLALPYAGHPEYRAEWRP